MVWPVLMADDRCQKSKKKKKKNNNNKNKNKYYEELRKQCLPIGIYLWVANNN